MSKVSAKNATILISGSRFSTYASAYSAESMVDPIEATGFGDGSKNYLPGQATGRVTIDMMWDTTASTGVHAKMYNVGQAGGQTGHVTIIPETYAIGGVAISLPYMQSNYNPQGAVTDLIKIGSVNFESFGANSGVEFGNVLYQATITNTATSTAFDNGAATSGRYSGIIHIWTPTIVDTYAVKIEHSTNNSTWADLATFTITGSGQAITSARVTGTAVNRYRRVTATRTGSDADPFGLTVVLFTV
jgi:hypothetical protein